LAKALSKDDVLKSLSASKRRFRALGVRRIGLFGSFARGEQRKGSDLDILVEFERGKKSFDNYMDLKFLLEDLFGRDVDLVVKEAIRPALRNSILEGAVYAA